MRKKIQIIIDNPLRDLPAGVLLAAQFAKRGFTAMLTSFDNAPYETFRFKPDYLFTNYARKTNEVFLSRMISAGIPFGVLDTEGGVFVKMEKEGGKPNFVKTLTQNKQVISNIEDYFVWGEVTAEVMKQEWPLARKAIQLFGTPRTDALHPTWSLKNSERNLILLNTSFTLVNTKFRPVEQEIEDLIKVFGFDREEVETAAIEQKKLVADFISITKELAAKFPDEKFLLRPHPFEKHDSYLSAFKGIKNIEVRGDQTIDYWLGRSKALFHYECSTAIEAALVDVPAFSMKAAAATRPIEAVAMLTDYCHSEEELFQKIQMVLTKRYSRSSSFIRDRDQVIKQIYYRFDGEASERIAEYISKKIEKIPHVRKIIATIWQSFYFLRNLAKRLAGKQIVRDAKKFEQVDVEKILVRFQNAPGAISKDIKAHADGDSIIVEKH